MLGAGGETLRLLREEKHLAMGCQWESVDAAGTLMEFWDAAPEEVLPWLAVL